MIIAKNLSCKMCQISIDLSEQRNTTHHSHILRVDPNPAAAHLAMALADDQNPRPDCEMSLPNSCALSSNPKVHLLVIYSIMSIFNWLRTALRLLCMGTRRPSQGIILLACLCAFVLCIHPTPPQPPPSLLFGVRLRRKERNSQQC